MELCFAFICFHESLKSYYVVIKKEKIEKEKKGGFRIVYYSERLKSILFIWGTNVISCIFTITSRN